VKTSRVVKRKICVLILDISSSILEILMTMMTEIWEFKVFTTRWSDYTAVLYRFEIYNVQIIAGFSIAVTRH
jgi:hypothetical protein